MKQLFRMLFLVALAACNSSTTTSDTNTETEIFTAYSLKGGVASTPDLFLESKELLNHTLISKEIFGFPQVSFGIYRSADDLVADGLTAVDTSTVDFKMEMLLLVETLSTGGCFNGYSLARVVETDDAFQVFLKGIDSVGDESICTAIAGPGFDRFYKVPKTSKTVQGVDYKCGNTGACKFIELKN